MDGWHIATLKSSELISRDIRSMFFEVPDFPQFKAGQHCDIRLTSSDGYQAQRSYSIASAPSSESRSELIISEMISDLGVNKSQKLEFGIQILPDGEVSSYLDIMRVGEQIEIKGPIGGHFNWDSNMDSPILLIGAGSGIVPLLSIAREFINRNGNQRLLFIISARSLEDLAWRDEILKFNDLYKNIKVELFLTREWPENWDAFYTGRINMDKLKKVVAPWMVENKSPMTYVCGRTQFVELVATTLVRSGFNPNMIKTERYG